MNFYKLLFLFWLQIILVSCQESNSKKAGNDVMPLSEKAYAKLFLERKKDTKDLLQVFNNEGAYERKYRLLEGALDRLLNILQQTQARLQANRYDPLVNKFPQEPKLFEAVTVTLENVCVFGEIVLRNPDISYRVLDDRQFGPHWKDLVNWAIKFARHFNNRVIDKKSQELLWLFEQEINPEKRTENFIKPYRNKVESKEPAKPKKKAKKLERGPRMVTRDEF